MAEHEIRPTRPSEDVAAAARARRFDAEPGEALPSSRLSVRCAEETLHIVGVAAARARKTVKRFVLDVVLEACASTSAGDLQAVVLAAIGEAPPEALDAIEAALQARRARVSGGTR
jgi:uncharacterized protein (DUF1778 family)